MHREEGRGIVRRCSASFFNYVQPLLASRPRRGYPLRLSATLRLLGRTRDSPPLLILLSPSRNPLTTLFHPFICRSPLVFEKKILIESREIHAFSLSLRDASSRPSSSPSRHHSLDLSRVANHPHFLRTKSTLRTSNQPSI